MPTFQSSLLPNAVLYVVHHHLPLFAIITDFSIFMCMCTMCNYVVSIKCIVCDKIYQYQSELPTSFFFSWTSQLELELGLGLDYK